MSRQKKLENSYNRAIRAKLSSYKGSCKKREISWNLKVSDAWNLFMGDCSYCGRPAIESGDKNGFNGIDRVRSSGHYTPDNTCPCCPRCNIIKNDMSLSDLRAAIKRMYNYMNLWPVEFGNQPEFQTEDF